MPILIDRGENIECGEDVGDHKVQVSEGKVFPRTNPKSLTFIRVLW